MPLLSPCSPHLPPSEAGSGASGSTSCVPASPSTSSSAVGSWGSGGGIRAGHSVTFPPPDSHSPSRSHCRQSAQSGRSRSRQAAGRAGSSVPRCAMGQPPTHPPLTPHSPTAPRRGCCPPSHAPALPEAPTAWCRWGCANNRCPRCPAPASIPQAGLSLSQRSCGSRRNLGGVGGRGGMRLHLPTEPGRAQGPSA